MDKYAGSKCYNNNLYNAFGGESVSMSKHYHNIDVFYECVHTGTRIKDACLKIAAMQKCKEHVLVWYEKAIALANDCLQQDLSLVVGNESMWFDTGFKELSEIMYLAYEACKARKELLENM